MVFDYIIVGGGSAGCVLANRLSQNPHNKVLLVEAGNKDDKQEIHIPAAFSKLFKGVADWNYETEAQSALNNRKLYWPRAKVLGGCSSMNAMIYSRGHRKDYDEWESLGNPGWNFQSVLPFFKRSENHVSGDSADHGVGGPLQVNDLRSPNTLSLAFVSGCEQTGIRRNDNFNGESQDGAGLYHVTQSGGKRCSTAAAYIKPILGRSNLTILLNTRAQKVGFEGTRATSLEIVKDGQTFNVKATKEIILSSGAIASPQLLMLSGVGPKDHLDSLGIPVVADLPGVGQNLQDHLLLSLTYECTQPVSLASAESVLNLAKFLLMKKGMLTSNIAEAGAFVRTNQSLDRPDLQYIFGPAFYINHGFVQPKGHGFTIASCLIRPESRGTITLRSKNPLTYPKIQPNYLTREKDVNLLLEGLKLGRKIAQTAAMNPFRGLEFTPGSKVTTDEELVEFIKNTVETLYHPVGTCKMGSDALAVVDNTLAVKKVTGLRVVDASIMPIITGGNTNAPTIMIAEKASDAILARSA